MDFWAGFAWGMVALFVLEILVIVFIFIAYSKTASKNHAHRDATSHIGT